LQSLTDEELDQLEAEFKRLRIREARKVDHADVPIRSISS
jgi:hypothetical protein